MPYDNQGFNRGPIAPGLDAAQSLLIHARVHAIGGYFGISGLQSKAVEKFSELLRLYPVHEKNLVPLLQAVWSQPQDHGIKLREATIFLTRHHLDYLIIEERRLNDILDKTVVADICFDIIINLKLQSKSDHKLHELKLKAKDLKIIELEEKIARKDSPMNLEDPKDFPLLPKKDEC